MKKVGQFLLATLANLVSIFVFFLLGAIITDKIFKIRQQEQFFIGLIIIFIFAVLATRFLYNLYLKTHTHDENVL